MPALLPTLSALIATLLLLPMAGFVLLAGIHRAKHANVSATLCVGVGLVLSVYVAVQSRDATFLQTEWATFGGSATFRVGFHLDRLAAGMLVLIHLIGLLVLVFSRTYMQHEARQRQYYAFMLLFMGAMLGLVVAADLLTLYVFWELVGLASYLLIGFYRTPAAARAASKAFWTNRTADALFLIGILATFAQLGPAGLEFATFHNALPTALGLLLMAGAAGKSALLPFSGWLPSAMEGPTPVSALLHAATMVTAGIILLLRIQPLLSPDALAVLVAVGVLTALWAGVSATFQQDIKRVLAYSTIAQLGLMAVGIGTTHGAASLFHLFTHAFFKAGLFLGAGLIIHLFHTQQLGQMSGLRHRQPILFGCYVICAASLAGLPFFSGFLSKESLLAGVWAWASAGGPLRIATFGATLLAASLTAVYMARQVRLIFFGEPNNNVATDSNWPMLWPVAALAAGALWLGWSLNPFTPNATWFFSVFPPENATLVSMSGVATPGWLAPVATLLSVAGGWFGWRLGSHATQRSALAEDGFHLDALYQYLITKPLLRVSHGLNRFDARAIDGAVNGAGVGAVVLAHLTRFADRRLIDGLVNALANVANWLGGRLRRLQTGRVQQGIALAVGLIVLLLWWLR